MITPAWSEDWWASAHPLGMTAWRAVEAQHVVATMRLVDTLDEQAVLEQLLEKSKPPLAAGSEGRHYLLTTPFRYRSPHGSRFRRGGTRGVWYGAATVKTACAEVAYWRWRFLVDSDGLRSDDLLTEHTVFSATVQGIAVDLTANPWAQQRSAWLDSADYSQTQALGEAARGRNVQWLRYESARDRGGLCCAVLTPTALTAIQVDSQQTWHCRTTKDAVRMVHGDDRFEWRHFGMPQA